ncbi:MAG: glycosyltransferase family 2 protein, partial [Cyanobacteria bacterium NC_groundwater_1444_Ag_S-0.65um_54_12]|nr:glycosyltransferase family 2 protein [Cyanobacteria bacterium NC_groundwater_1444_Ag_S-0.65um_54_12]
VVVTESWLTLLLRCFVVDPRIGIVGPRSNRVASSQQVAEANYPSLSAMHDFARQRRRRCAGQGFFTDIVIGFALLARSAVVRKIGGLDPTFGIGNFEDDDFCLRAQLAGYRIWVADDVFLHHFGSVTFKSKHYDYDWLITENSGKFGEKWRCLVPPGFRPQLQALAALWQEKIRPEDLLIPLPAPATVPLVVEPLTIEGLKDRNLLLLPDWDSPVASWESVVLHYAKTFAAAASVTLIVPAAPPHALERLTKILEEAVPQGETPDVLAIERAEPLFNLVAAAQGIVLVGGPHDAELRHLACILAKPVMEFPDGPVLARWASGG